MFEILVIAVFLWLLFKVLGVVFKLTWGLAKVAACILMLVAAPGLVMGLIFAGGVMLLVPLALIGLAFGIARFCG